MHNEKCSQHLTFKKGLLLGGLVGGTIVGLLMTEKGRMLRRNLQTDIQELAKQIQARAKEFGDTTHEMYDELVDTAVDEYAKRKDMAVEMKDIVVRELKRKWWEFQVYTVYLQVKRKLENVMDVTENTYAELAAEVVGEYAEKKSLMGYWKNKLLREVKGKWAAYQDEYQNFTDENKKSDQV
jgi:gas vesicle protein